MRTGKSDLSFSEVRKFLQVLPAHPRQPCQAGALRVARWECQHAVPSWDRWLLLPPISVLCTLPLMHRAGGCSRASPGNKAGPRAEGRRRRARLQFWASGHTIRFVNKQRLRPCWVWLGTPASCCHCPWANERTV